MNKMKTQIVSSRARGQVARLNECRGVTPGRVSFLSATAIYVPLVPICVTLSLVWASLVQNTARR